jgi:hypothetical protein
MSLPASQLPSLHFLRPLLALSVAVVGLVVLAPLPAYALESKTFGDVVVAPGETESEVSTAAGDVTVDGRVEGDVRSALGDVAVDGRGVGGGINAGFGDVKVRAPVGGEVDAGFGDVYVAAPVGGNLDVGRGNVVLARGASVSGDLSCGGCEIHGNKEAVGGTVTTGVGPEMNHHWHDFRILNLVGWIFAAAVFAACSVLAAVLAPRPLYAAARKAEESPALSLLFGVASVPAVVVFSVVLAVSIIGIPLLLLLAPAYLALVFFGALVAAYFVGRRVVFATGGYHVGNALAAAVGAIILAAAYLIPVLGGLLIYGLALFGAGASVLALVSRPSRTYPTYEAYVRSRRDA